MFGIRNINSPTNSPAICWTDSGSAVGCLQRGWERCWGLRSLGGGFSTCPVQPATYKFIFPSSPSPLLSPPECLLIWLPRRSVWAPEECRGWRPAGRTSKGWVARRTEPQGNLLRTRATTGPTQIHPGPAGRWLPEAAMDARSVCWSSGCCLRNVPDYRYVRRLPPGKIEKGFVGRGSPGISWLLTSLKRE